MKMVIRHAEPEDYEALHRIFSGSRVIEAPRNSLVSLRKCGVNLSPRSPGCLRPGGLRRQEVVGDMILETHPTFWRRRHVAQIGIAVSDDWQDKGVGTALMEAALDLADNLLNLTRIELTVYTDNAAGAAFQKDKNGGLNFRALLMENGTQRVELARA